MSAANLLLGRRDGAHLLVDAASYFSDGVVYRMLDKTVALNDLHLAVTVLGLYDAEDLVVAAIRENFSSFDEVRRGIAPVLRELFASHAHILDNGMPDATAEAWVIGWSQEHHHVEAFTIFMCGPEEWAEWQQRSPEAYSGMAPFRPNPITAALSFSPVPTARQLYEGGLAHIGSPPDDLNPELDLLQLMEVQRRMTFGEPLRHRVGGYALLTSIDREGVRQRVIHRWPEDAEGELIQPRPINYSNWRAERTGTVPCAKPPPLMNMNRKQRRAFDKQKRAS